MEAGNRTAMLLCAHQKHWNPLIEQALVKHMLPLKNSAWLDEDEKPITEEQLLASLRVQTLVIGPEQKFSFWLNDRNLFFGHSVVVNGSLKDGIAKAELS